MTDPNYSHLGELLTLMREEMRTGFAKLETGLGHRVPVEVYEAEKRLTEERLGRIAAEVAELRADLDRAEERAQAERVRAEEAEDAERARAADRRAADRRMVWGAVITSAVALALALFKHFTT